VGVGAPSMFDDEFENGADRTGRIPEPVQSPLERWTSLSACVLDAVWSVGAHHDRVVVPLVHRVLEPAATGPLTSEAAPTVDPHPLPRLLTRFPDDEALQQAAQNRQRTSTRNGVTRADAALRFARTLVSHGVLGVEDLPRLVVDPESWSRVDRALSRIPGEGQQGARRTYFWTLCGVRDNTGSRISLL
jgi:hypothetical protein